MESFACCVIVRMAMRMKSIRQNAFYALFWRDSGGQKRNKKSEVDFLGYNLEYENGWFWEIKIA